MVMDVKTNALVPFRQLSQQPLPQLPVQQPLALTDRPWHEIEQGRVNQRNSESARLVRPQFDMMEALRSSDVLSRLFNQEVSSAIRICLPCEFPQLVQGVQQLQIEDIPSLMGQSQARQSVDRLSTEIKKKVGELFVDIVQGIGFQPYLAGGGAIHLRHPDSTRTIQDLDFRIEAEESIKDFRGIEGSFLLQRLNQELRAMNADDPRLAALKELHSQAGKLMESPEVQQVLTDNDRSLFQKCANPGEITQFQPHGKQALTIMCSDLLGVEVSISLNQGWKHETPSLLPQSTIPALTSQDLLRDKLKTVITRTKYGDENVKKVAQDLVDVLSVADNLQHFESSLRYVQQEMQTRVAQYRVMNLETSEQVLQLRDDLLSLRMADRLLRTVDSHLGYGSDDERSVKFQELVNRIPSSHAVEIGTELLELRGQVRQELNAVLDEFRGQVERYLAQRQDPSGIAMPEQLGQEQQVLDLIDSFYDGHDLDQWFSTWNATKSQPRGVSQAASSSKIIEWGPQTSIDEILLLVPQDLPISNQEKILLTLHVGEGFRPLENLNDRNLLKAFGLSRSQYNRAWGELRKQGYAPQNMANPSQYLAPQLDGLHLQPPHTIKSIVTTRPEHFPILKAMFDRQILD